MEGDESVSSDVHAGQDGPSLNECQALRHLKAAGWSMGEIEMAFHHGSTAIQNHINGHCDHPDVAEPKAAVAPHPDELVAFRYANDLNQTAAAEAVGVSLGAWQQWERGNKKPNEKHRRILADLIDYSELPDEVPDDFGNKGRPKGGSIDA